MRKLIRARQASWLPLRILMNGKFLSRHCVLIIAITHYYASIIRAGLSLITPESEAGAGGRVTAGAGGRGGGGGDAI